MPLFKCTKCHHEWEGANCMCDWCGAIGEILEEKTPLEKSMDIDELRKKIDDYFSDVTKEKLSKDLSKAGLETYSDVDINILDIKGDEIIKMKWCDCKEKIVLEKGDGSFIAYESWCPKHGYYTNCYRCNPKDGVFHTELCKRHTYKEKEE